MLNTKKISTTSLLLFFTMAASNASAELHRASISVGYWDQTTELSALGQSVDVDSDGIFFSGNIFLTENLSVGASLSDGELDDTVLDIDTESTSFGVQYHFSRTDLRLGEGSGASLGFRRTNSEVSIAGIGSVDDDYNYADLSLSYGLGNGLTLGGGYTADLDEVGDNYSMNIGITQSFGDALISASYRYGEVNSDSIISSEVEGFQISLGYLF